MSTEDGRPLTREYVAEVLKPLEADGMAHGAFPDRLADDLHWTIKGSHPLAGTYTSKKAFQDGALKRISGGLQGHLRVQIKSILVDDPWTVVEHKAIGAKATAGWAYDQEYCWVLRFSKGKIVEARAYFDGLMVKRCIDEIEPA